MPDDETQTAQPLEGEAPPAPSPEEYAQAAAGGEGQPTTDDGAGGYGPGPGAADGEEAEQGSEGERPGPTLQGVQVVQDNVSEPGVEQTHHVSASGDVLATSTHRTTPEEDEGDGDHDGDDPAGT